MNREQEENVDRILDLLLANYSAVEPRPGLEGRILESLRSQPANRASGFWLASVAVVAVLAIAGWMFRSPSRTTTVSPAAMTEPRSEQSPTPSAVSQAPSRLFATSAIRDDRRSSAVLHQPRREQFPSATPLSEQEHLLATYVLQQHHGSATARDPMPRLEQPMAELEIRNLEISLIEGKP